MFDQEVMVKLRGGGVLGPGRAVNYDWCRHDDIIDITEYCTVTEKVDLGTAEQLLRANGYTVPLPEMWNPEYEYARNRWALLGWLIDQTAPTLTKPESP